MSEDGNILSMKNERRNFLKIAGLGGIGLASTSMTGHTSELTHLQEYLPTSHKKFNMHGYAAPKLPTVRVGVIGIGGRGTATVRRLTHIEGVEIKALCDLVPEKVSAAIEMIKDTPHKPDAYSGSPDSWKKVCERKDIDLIYIVTPWDLHTPMAVCAMEHEKHAAIEVPAATTIEECWQLVETSERTRQHCMMLENCCYDRFELLTLNMARQGFFGEIIHGEGAYMHDRTKRIFDKEGTTWRLEENVERNGNLYPTHGLGPICQIMDINYGDKMDYLVSVSSKDFTMGNKAKELAATDDFWKPYANKKFRGNINTSTIRTNRGRTIMLQHDCSSPRPYSRLHVVSGTKAFAQKYPLPAHISIGDEWVPEGEFKELEEKYNPEIIKRIGEMATKVGGHGGMDALMDWRFIDCLRNGLPLDMDVYDAALWSAIAPLSEASVANRSNSVDVPDFTSGAWKNNKQGMDISLAEGGTTKIIQGS